MCELGKELMMTQKISETLHVDNRDMAQGIRVLEGQINSLKVGGFCDASVLIFCSNLVS